MPRRLFAMIASVLLLSTSSFAVVVVQSGNRPYPADPFNEWPGLIDVVNDASRVGIVWCNGNAWLSYRGDVSALNRMLKEFAEVEADARIVVLVPARRRTEVQDVAQRRTNEPLWKLNVALGAVRKHRQGKLRHIDDLNPKLWISIDDHIPLDALEIPDGITLLQTGDIRARHAQTIATGSKYVKMRAENELRQFEAEIPVEGPDAEEHRARLAAIEEFVRKHAAAKSLD